MDITITPGMLRGTVRAIPSKSQAHRLLICAAFADRITTLECRDTNRDIEATADCLRALGADIQRTKDGYIITPISQVSSKAILNCCESGSTLRFMLPIAGALGVDATFLMEGRLPYRPLSPLWEEMIRMGCSLTRPTTTSIRCTGNLRPGAYSIDGSVSSQFITGLLFALSLLHDASTLTITGKVESKPYIDMTIQAMELFEVDCNHLGNVSFRSPGVIKVEGDWSNGAFFLAANAIGSPVNVTGLNHDSRQGDRIALNLMQAITQDFTEVDVTDIPDLVPILSVVAACHHGAAFHNIGRLRIKESDRVAAVCSMLQNLGCTATADDTTLTVYPSSFTGGIVDSFGDHRIAMSAAIAATAAKDNVVILGAECVGKSYPSFWQDYGKLGGIYEQYLR